MAKTESRGVPTRRTGAPYIRANENVPIQSGPGNDYPTIGYMAQGLIAEVSGVSPDAAWWMIVYPPGPSGQGWVSAAYVTAQNTGNVPVVQPAPAPGPTAAPPVAITDWRGEYFDNRDLQGEPVLVRNDAKIDFDWSGNSPDPTVPGENFSVRWTISRDMPAGTYRFSIWVDDGVRLWVDDSLVVDDWRDGVARNVTADVNWTQGVHSARVEYFQGGDAALIHMNVGYLDQFPDWKSEYFDNPDVAGDPVLLRNETNISYNWGTGSPAPGVPADNFSVRWSRRTFFEEGEYTVWVDVAGGVRVWIDGVLLIDSWTSEPLRALSAEAGKISEGDHDIRVDYLKTTGHGQIVASASKVQSADGPPKAGINGATEAQAGQPVSFNARSSSVAAGSYISTYQWDFGDGTTASGVDVVHIFTAAGVYEVRLTVTDDKGRGDTGGHQTQINPADTPPVEGEPPTAIIMAPGDGVVGQPVTFDASNSQSTNPILSYSWRFGDGTTANAVVANTTYHAPGVYNVILVLTDNLGLQGSANAQINIVGAEGEETPVPTVEPAPTAGTLPSPSINAPPDGKVGEPVTFDGSGSQPGSFPIASYTWDFGDGSGGDGATVTHVYNAAGTYQVTLTVTDEQGFANVGGVGIVITESEVPEPTPTETETVLPSPVINAPSDGTVGEPVTIDGSGSQPGGFPIASYTWDFGDGSSGDGATATHVYNAAGTYQVTLTVTDEQGFANMGGPVPITITE